MNHWTVEFGTFWVYEPGAGLPPSYSARLEAEFHEIKIEELDHLVTAMKANASESIRQRFQGGRRCFGLKTAGQLIAYGWVTEGTEHVGELERDFNLHDDEAYVWDCGTLPEWRGQRCYTQLLNQIIYQLHQEDVSRIWIGASRQNQPSIQGIANAGFQQVINLTYWRYFRLTTLWFQENPAASSALISAAYRILLDTHERRFGRFAIGLKHG